MIRIGVMALMLVHPPGIAHSQQQVPREKAKERVLPLSHEHRMMARIVSWNPSWAETIASDTASSARSHGFRNTRGCFGSGPASAISFLEAAYRRFRCGPSRALSLDVPSGRAA